MQNIARESILIVSRATARFKFSQLFTLKKIFYNNTNIDTLTVAAKISLSNLNVLSQFPQIIVKIIKILADK